MILSPLDFRARKGMNFDQILRSNIEKYSREVKVKAKAKAKAKETVWCEDYSMLLYHI